MLGRYAFTIPDMVARGELRPLRDPGARASTTREVAPYVGFLFRCYSTPISIKRDWEGDPFVKMFYLPRCPLVGPNFATSFEGSLQYHDHPDYGDGTWKDAEFADALNTRSPEAVFKTGP